MTRNEARGILIRMQSEIENPYSTEAQALGIAIEKLMRDYETDYWESQWKIDEYEGLLASAETEKTARREIEKLYENLYTEMYAEYCDFQRTHQGTMDAFAEGSRNVKHPTILPLPEEGKEYVVPSKKERAADALIRYCENKEWCDNCPFSNALFCRLAEVTKEGTPNEWDEGTCKVENRPVDERNPEDSIREDNV
jgi:hypothetical protein